MARVDSKRKVERIQAALPRLRALVASCRVCGRACGVDRTGPAVGYCRADAGDGDHARWSAATLHFGEEPMLVGQGGSGTVFFSHCNLRCLFCQNWQISHEGEGRTAHFEALADAFLDLQGRGAENINLVTPTQYIYPAVQALGHAYAQGLDLPVVYNTNGYDAVDLVEALDGIVDVWLPDVKYMESAPAARYSRAADYPEVALAAVLTMWRQTGSLVLENGAARRGVIIRHLVLPENQSGTFEFLLWLKDQGMAEVTLSLMSQYSPQFRAAECPEINRPLTPKEYDDVVDFAANLGFEHVLTQEMDSRAVYLPDFERDEPFRQ
jgi:putative pyruvate formate lyase activating enzyme